MKPLRIVELEPIFPHEGTELYRRARELHAFSAQLEMEAGNTRYFGALTQAGLLAMLSVASAGVAPTDRARARCLARLRSGLSRFASTLRSMADRALLEENALRFGAKLVASAEALVDNFDIELKAAEASLIVQSRDAERERLQEDAARPGPVDADLGHNAADAARTLPVSGAVAAPANDEGRERPSRGTAPPKPRDRRQRGKRAAPDHLRRP
jgi:hypothetical protein